MKRKKPKRMVVRVVWEEKNVRLEIVQDDMVMNYVKTVLLFLATHLCKVINACKNAKTIDQFISAFLNFRNLGGSPLVEG